jgi:hypothetical protein
MNENGEQLSEETLEPSMDILYSAIQDTLRKGDVFTKYSSSQYVVMLPSANAEKGGEIAAKRLRDYFDKIKKDPGVVLKTDLTMMNMVERS